MVNKAQEIWETTTAGSTFVNVKDPRNSEGWVVKRVGGRGSKRITLTVEEREFNEELVAWENEGQCPFRNGLLVRVSPKDAERTEHEMNDDQLIEVLSIDDDAVFASTLDSIKSEVIIRRLAGLARERVSVARFEIIQTIIDERYAVGKTSRVVQEVLEDDAKYARADF